MGNFDLKIQPFGFYYCPILLICELRADFCNSIGQKRTHAPQQIISLFDYVVGQRQQSWRNFEAEHLGSLG
jgi:hypothetical protein